MFEKKHLIALLQKNILKKKLENKKCKILRKLLYLFLKLKMRESERERHTSFQASKLVPSHFPFPF